MAAQMKNRNKHLQGVLESLVPKTNIVEAQNVPAEDTTNIQGFVAYSLDDKLRLVTMLNTLKLEPQFYRSENETVKELKELVDRVGAEDPYFLAQAIVYSRCMGEGMRLINQVAAALAAPYLSGKEFGKRFYGLFDKQNQRGGCIFRVDDMSTIKDVYSSVFKSALSNAMKKGFAKNLENLGTYQLAKYSKTVIDIANLVHPNPTLSKAIITSDGVEKRVLDALMKGETVSADTWEVAQSQAGQTVAKAVKEGKLTEEEGKAILVEAKNDNWESLLREGKLGILAALRNIRNMMKEPRKDIIDMLCALITDQEKIRKSLILPCYFDFAYDILQSEFSNKDYVHQVSAALQKGYEESIPNLAQILTGRTLVVVDCSGSMDDCCSLEGGKRDSRCSYKAGLIAATMVKATKADVVKFGSTAKYFPCDLHEDVFTLSKKIGTSNYNCTDLASAFNLLVGMKKSYDRIVIISDNEVNGNVTSCAYKNYIVNVCSPAIYAIDLAAYGTTPLKNEDRISYYFGYGPSLYEDIKNHEFNAESVIDKIRKIII